MLAGERPKVRTTVAAAARGKIVQLRMRPSEQGSTTSAGRADLKVSMMALNSSSVMRSAATAALLTVIVVAPMPAAFIAFQMGPLEPSERPYRTVSRWRWKTKRTKRLPAARRSVSEMTGIVNPWPCSTRYRSTAIAGAAISWLSLWAVGVSPATGAAREGNEPLHARWG